MAISRSFFGLRRGSTKSHTYSIFNGKQVTKDRVSEVKNPRSIAQMRTRMILATAGSLYKNFKQICDHSWEGKSYGLKSMNYFMSETMKSLKSAAYAGSTELAFNAYGNNYPAPAAVKVSEGTLDPITGITIASGTGAGTLDLAVGTSVSVAQLKSILGLQTGDLLTFVGWCYGGVGQFGDGAQITQSVGAGLVIARMTIPADSETVITADNLRTLFTIEENKTNALTFADGKLSLVGSTGGTLLGMGTIIKSRKGDNGWLRSTQELVITDALPEADVYTYDDVLATYPVGAEYILNGADF